MMRAPEDVVELIEMPPRNFNGRSTRNATGNLTRIADYLFSRADSRKIAANLISPWHNRFELVPAGLVVVEV
jgi:hypothetical protein